MIARINRFRGHNSLRKLYQNSRSVRTAAMTMRFAPNNRENSFRAAVVVSKKVSKSAVVRNRIRRRVYEQIRLAAPRMTQSADIVITIFEEQLATTPAKQLQADIQHLLKEAQLIP